MLRSELLKKYEVAKKCKLEVCEEDAERIKKLKNKKTIEAERRSAIYFADKKQRELKGMLELLSNTDVITVEEYEKEKQEVEELFSPKRLFGAKVSFATGKLKSYASEIKKED